MITMRELYVQVEEMLEKGDNPYRIASIYEIPVDWVFAVEANMLLDRGRCQTIEEFDSYAEM